MSGVESGFTSRFNKLMVRNRLDCRIPVCQRLFVPRPLSFYALLNLAQSTRPFQDELTAQVRHLPPYFIGKSDFWTLPYIERCQDLKNTRNCTVGRNANRHCDLRPLETEQVRLLKRPTKV